MSEDFCYTSLMDKFYELSHMPESEKTLEDYSYPELRVEKLALYEEMQEHFQIDFFSESEEAITKFLESLNGNQKIEALEFLADIVKTIAEQIEKLKTDEVPDTEQFDTIDSLKSEQSRVNRFLIKLNYFK